MAIKRKRDVIHKTRRTLMYHNAIKGGPSHRKHARTHACMHARTHTCTHKHFMACLDFVRDKKLAKFRHVVFELYEQTDRQTDKQTHMILMQ